jgi:hypothetical protein
MSKRLNSKAIKKENKEINLSFSKKLPSNIRQIILDFYSGYHENYKKKLTIRVALNEGLEDIVGQNEFLFYRK